MELNSDFSFQQNPPIDPAPLRFALPTDNPLGPLQDLLGTWTGKGFNVIWRPNSTPGQDRFLELNLTDETIKFDEISGPIPNRGLLQPDINMFGLTYLDQIKDANTKSGLHVEPGIWATVPQTQNPAEVPTVVRMASIPHGTTILAQGIIAAHAGPPVIPNTNITPFVIGSPNQKINFPESNLALPSVFRSPPNDITGITQAMVDNPNSVLTSALAGAQILQTTVLQISTNSTAPVPGGGVANTAFLQGNATPPPNGSPNARTAEVSAIFWIETVQLSPGGTVFHQLQYTQTVLLNFNGLSWPHVTVATLKKET